MLCSVNWPAASSPSVKIKLHVSQSQKNMGVWPALLAPRSELISTDLAVISDSNANSLPLPSFRNEARHSGLAHLPSMGIPDAPTLCAALAFPYRLKEARADKKTRRLTLMRKKYGDTTLWYRTRSREVSGQPIKTCLPGFASLIRFVRHRHVLSSSGPTLQFA
jgi:hypothetical protein